MVGIELAMTDSTKPVSNFHQLFLERSLLFSAQMLNLDVALKPKELLDVVDGLTIDSLKV